MSFTTRPSYMCTHGLVASTHYLASEAGYHVLKKGGNVVDAGATMWFCLTLLKPHLAGVAGEVPILLYWSDEDRVIAINGQGPAPKAATIEWFKEHDYPMIPEDGFLPAVVPGAFDAWLITLKEYGTYTVKQVLEPALRIASEGFPAYPKLVDFLEKSKTRYLKEWPSTSEIYLPGGDVPEIGQLLNNRDWGRTFKNVVKAESKERRLGRSKGIDAARDYFYRGPIAKNVIQFLHSFKPRDVYGGRHYGLLELKDFEKYEACFEEPVSTNYRGVDIHKCGPWCQGPVMLEMLNLLEGYDLRNMGHNSVDYLHTWIECAKLAFADREQYYADPEFVDVPLEWLLSKDYAEERRRLINPSEASMMLRPGGIEPIELKKVTRESIFEGDTVHLEAVDSNGNMISATPSGAWIRTSPIIPGLGFCMGTRAQMLHLDSKHVECLEPSKKPSTTLTPSLVTKNREPYMTFGTPGGDRQDQWTLQFFLNYFDFGMNIQEALDAPTIHINHFPASFWPHSVKPGEVAVEPRISKAEREGLEKRGHKIILSAPWSHGRCLGIRYDPRTGLITGGASPRTGDPYVIGW